MAKKTTSPKSRALKVLPEGINLAYLQRSQEVADLTFEHEGQAWTFQYTTVSWAEHWKAVEAAWEPGGDGLEFNVEGYYHSLLPQIIVGIPGGGPLTKEFLDGLDTAVVAKLATVVPSPVLDREVEEVKKELRPTPPPEATTGDTAPS